MKLGKKIGRIGFVIGFLGPLLCYGSGPISSNAQHLLCLWCPYIDVAFATRLIWIQIGLTYGLISGLVLAVVGFSIGFIIAKFRYLD